MKSTIISFIDNKLSADHFEPNYLETQQLITGTAQGRGITWFFSDNNHEYVLRRYHRGGLVAKILTDQYLYTGLKRTVAWKEAHLLNKLHQVGCPVPKAIACRINYHGFYYTADLITEKIPNAASLATRLQQQALPGEIWYQIGNTIKQLHDHNVYHHDLNAHNILIDQNNKIWLIDFDKCVFKNMNKHHRFKNMVRLQRSLLKIQQQANTFYWQASDWQALSESYSSV